MSYGDVAVFGDSKTADVRDYSDAGMSYWNIYPADGLEKKGEENEPWQFAWCDPNPTYMDVHALPQNGYRFVEEDEWTLPKDCRFRFNAEHKIGFMGQVLMYRRAELHFQAMKRERDAVANRISDHGMAIAEDADRIGFGLSQTFGEEEKVIVKPKSKLNIFGK